jgi:hypothetical protein
MAERNEAERLLALHPRIASAGFHAALLLGKDDVVAAQLARDPETRPVRAARAAGEPAHVCHTSLGRSAAAESCGTRGQRAPPARAGRRSQHALPWLHHGVRRPALWGAVSATRSLPLAAVLLEAGADSDDG